jgi:O-antigen/teichoic acid export membrane protein
MGARFVRGTLYLGAANWISFAINFGIILMVARLLGPESFGLYAFAAAVNEFISIVNGFAIAPALVQSREESDSRYDTGYAMSLGQGLLGLAIAGIVAPFLWTHRGPEAAWFLLLLGLVRIFKLLGDVPFAKLDRAVRYGPIATIHLTTRNVPNFVCLGLAWIGYGPWSLIVRDLFFATLPFLMAHWWAGYRFRGRVERKAFHSIMSYSGPMFVTRALDVFLERFDRLCVGWLFGNTPIGLYSQARFLAEAGAVALRPLNQPAFNLYSRLQDAPKRIARSYSIMNYFLVRVLFGGVAVLLVYPAETIRLLLGPEWTEAAPILRCLAVYGALSPLLDHMRTLLFARARVLITARMRLAQLAVFLPGVLVAGYTGSIIGVALSLVAAVTVGVLLAWWYNREIVGGTGLRIYATPLIVLGGTVAGFSLAGSRGWLDGWPFWVLPFLPAIAFWLLLALLDRRTLVGELRYLRRQLRGVAPADAPASD